MKSRTTSAFPSRKGEPAIEYWFSFVGQSENPVTWLVTSTAYFAPIADAASSHWSVFSSVGAKDSASRGFAVVQGERGWMELEGAPNELPRVTLHADGKDCVVELNRYENRMVSEFQSFAKIFAEGDWEAVRRSNEQSLLVAKLVDELRRSAGLQAAH